MQQKRFLPSIPAFSQPKNCEKQNKTRVEHQKGFNILLLISISHHFVTSRLNVQHVRDCRSYMQQTFFYHMKRDSSKTAKYHISKTPTRGVNRKLTSVDTTPLSSSQTCHRKCISRVKMCLLLDDITCSTNVIMRIRNWGYNLPSFPFSIFVQSQNSIRKEENWGEDASQQCFGHKVMET